MKPKFCLSKSIATVLASTLALAGSVHALPKGEVVKSGSATFERDGGRLNIRAGNRAIIDYRSFDIAKGEKVRFLQPDRNSTVLNRVTDSNPTRIFGTLESNGRIVVLNPYGIFFENGSVISVGGIVAAAGSMSDSDFIAGRGNIALSGKVENHGSITAIDGVSLYGTSVENSGTISSQSGAIEMMAGSQVYVGEAGGNIFAGSAPQAPRPAVISTPKGAVHNAGTLAAPKVKLVAGDAYGLAVANTGNITSQDVTLHSHQGDVAVGGRVDASNRGNGKAGGTVKVSGKQVTLRNSLVDASGDAGGGTIQIDGETIANGGIVRANAGDNARAGTISMVASNTLTLEATSVIEARGEAVNSSGGTVYLYSAGDAFAQAGQVIDISGGTISGDGGNAEFSAGILASFDGSIIGTAAEGSTTGSFVMDPISANAAGNFAANTTIFAQDNITVTADVNIAAGVTLTLLADHKSLVLGDWDDGSNVGSGVPPLGGGAGGIIRGGAFTINGVDATSALVMFAGGGGIGSSGNRILTNMNGGSISVNTSNVLQNGAAPTFITDSGSAVLAGYNAGTNANNLDIATNGTLTLSGAVNAGSGTVLLSANQDGAGAQGFTMGAGSSIATTNTTAGAVAINVNAAGGGTGTAALRSISTGAGGTIAVTTSTGGNATGGSISQTAATTLNVGAAGTISLSVPAGGAGSVGTNGANILTTSAGGTLNLTAGSGGAFVTNTGNVTLAAPTLNANSPLSVVSSGTLTLPASAISTGTGNLTLRSNGGTLATAATLTTGTGALTLAGATGLTVGHTLTTGSGPISLSSSVSGAISLSAGGITSTSGTLSIFAQDGVSVSAPINTGSGSISIAANSNSAGNEGFSQTAAGTITTTNATVNAVSVLVNTAVGGTGGAVLGSISTGAGGTITVGTNTGGNVTGGSITQIAASALNVGAAGTVSLSVPSAGASGVGTNGANILTTSAGGTLNLTAGSGGAFLNNTGNATLASPTLNANSPLSVISSGVLTLPAAAISTGTGDLTLRSNGGTLATAGTLTTGSGALTLTGSTGLTVGHTLTSGSGPINLSTSAATGDFNLTAGGITSTSGVLGIAAANVVDIAAPINTGSGAITIGANGNGTNNQGFTQSAAAGSITTTSSVTINVNAAGGGTGGATLRGISSGAGGISVLTNFGGNTSGGSITQTSGTLATAATGSVTLQTGGAGSGIGTLVSNIQTSTDTVVASSGTNGIFITEANAAAFTATATGDIRLTTTAGDLDIVGNTSAGGGNIQLTSSAAINLNANLTGATITTDGSLSPGGNANAATVTINGNLVINTGEYYVTIGTNTDYIDVNGSATIGIGVTLDGEGDPDSVGVAFRILESNNNLGGVLERFTPANTATIDGRDYAVAYPNGGLRGVTLTAAAKSFTWLGNGGGGSAVNWSNKNNWQPDSGPKKTPKNGDSVLFDLNATTASSTFDYNADVTLKSITFNTTAPFAVNYSGTRKILLTDPTGGVSDTSAFANSFAVPLELTGAIPFTTGNSASLTLTGAITGTGTLNKAGGGVLTIGGATPNTFSGGLNLTAGTLNINKGTALGATASVFTISPGTVINNTSGGAVTIANANPQVWNGDVTFTGTNPLNLGTGPVTISADQLVSVNGSTLTVGGVIDDGAGSFSIIKVGVGALTLAGANTFGGAGDGVLLNAGTLNLNNAGALGNSANTFVINGGVIDNTSGVAITLGAYPQVWNADVVFTGTNALNLGSGPVSIFSDRIVTTNGSTLTVGGVIDDGASSLQLTKAGAGALTLAGANTFGGVGEAVTLNAGTLNLDNPAALGNSANLFVINGGTLGNTSGAPVTLNNYAQNWAGDFAFVGPDVLNLGTGPVSLSASRIVTSNAGNLIVGGIIDDGVSVFSLTKAGPGAMTLAGANTFGGLGATVTLSAGTLNLNSAAALGDSANLFVINGGTLGNTSGGQVTLNNYVQNWNADFAFAGPDPLNLGAGAVTLSANRAVNVAASTLTVGGAIGDGGAAFSLTKAGPGTLVLSGANTYTGGTIINTGTLQIGVGGTSGSILGNVTANGALVINRSDAVAFPGTIIGTGSLQVLQSGGVQFAGVVNVGNIILTDTADFTTIAFQANTTATAGMTVAANGSYSVSFTGASNSIAGTTNFANTGFVTLGALATDVSAFTGGLSTTTGPLITITAGTIQTANAQIDLGPVFMTANTTLLSGSAALNVAAVSDGVANFTLALGNAAQTGAATISGNATVGALATSPGNYDVALLGTNTTIDSDTNFFNLGTVTLGNGAGDVLTFVGGLDTNLGPSATSIFGTVQTGGGQMDLAPVTLAGDSTLASGAGAVNIASITDGGSTFTLSIGVAGQTGAVTVLGDATIGALNTQPGAYNVLLLGTTTTVDGDSNFLNQGSVTLGNGVGDTLTFAGGLDTSGGPVMTFIAGTVRTTNTQMDLGPVTMTNDVTLLSGSGATNVASITDGLPNFTLTFGNAAQTGAMTVIGNATINTLATAAGAYNVALLGATTVDTNTNFQNTGSVTLGDSVLDVLTFTNGLSTTAGPSGTNIAGIIQTVTGPLNLGDTTMTDTAALLSGASATNVASITDGLSSFSLFLGNLAQTGTMTVLGDATIGALSTSPGNYSVSLLGTTTTVDSDTNFFNLGTVTLGNDVTDTLTFVGGLSTLTGPAATNIAGTVQTVNAQMDLAPVTMTADATLLSGTGLINIASITDGAASLDLTLGNLVQLGSITVLGNATVDTLVTAPGGYSVALLGTTTQITTDTNFLNLGTVTLGDGAGDTLTFGGGLDTTTGPIATRIAGIIETMDFQMDLGSTTMTDHATLRSRSGAINVASITDGALDLVLSAGAANQTGTITFIGNATFNTLTTFPNSYAIAFLGTTTTVDTDTNFQNQGPVTLGNDVGDTTTFIGGLSTTTGPSATNIAGIVQTINNQMDLAPTTMTANATLLSGTGLIIVASITDGASSFVLGVGGPTQTGRVTFIGDATVGEVTTFANPYDIFFQGSTTTVDADSTFLNQGVLVLGNDNADVVTFVGGLDTTQGPISTRIAGTVQTTNTQMDLGPVTITDNATIRSGTGIINVASLTDAPLDLDLSIGSGTQTGTATFLGDVTVNTVTTFASPYTIRFLGATTTMDTPNLTTFNNTGTLVLGDGADNLTFVGGLIATAPFVETAGNINTALANPVTLGSGTSTVILRGDTNIVTPTGLVTFQGTVDGNFALTVSTGNDTIFQQKVGNSPANGPLGSLLTNGGGRTVFRGAATSVKTSGFQNYQEAVAVELALAGRMSFVSTQAGGISFNSTLTALTPKASLLVQTGGNALFASDVKAANLDARVTGITTIGTPGLSSVVTTTGGHQIFNGRVSIPGATVTSTSNEFSIGGALGMDAGSRFVVNSGKVNLTGGISKNDGDLKVTASGGFVAGGEIKSNGIILVTATGKAAEFQKAISGSGTLTVDTGLLGSAKFDESVTQGTITVNSNLITIADANATFGDLSLKAQALLKLTGENYKSKKNIFFNQINSLALLNPDAGDATILKEDGDVTVEAGSKFVMGAGEKFLVDDGALTIDADSAEVGDLAAFTTLTIRAGSVLMLGREAGDFENDGREDLGLGFVAQIIDFTNASLSFAATGPEVATFATSTGLPRGVSRSLSNAGISFVSIDDFANQFHQAGTGLNPTGFGPLSLLQPVANGVRSGEATETQTIVIDDRPEPIVFNQDTSITSAVKEALLRMQIRPRDATADENLSMSLLRGLLRQPKEGSPKLEDNEYFVVVNRLVNEEVERVLDLYLTLTSSFYQDWPAQQKSARPSPSDFLELAVAGQIKGAPTLTDVYDKAGKLEVSLDALMQAYRGEDPNKDVAGFLEWLQRQRADAKIGKDASALADNFDLLAKLIDRLGKIGLTKKEYELSKISIVESIARNYPELVAILSGMPPAVVPAAIPSVVPDNSLLPPEAPLNIDPAGPPTVPPGQVAPPVVPATVPPAVPGAVPATPSVVPPVIPQIVPPAAPVVPSVIPSVVAPPAS